MKNKKSQQFNEIEQHPAWQGKLSLEGISILLGSEQPFTYTLSEFTNGKYFLSYITSHGIKHIFFRAITVIRNSHPKQGYRNGTNIIFSSLEALIRYKLKGKGLPLCILDLKLSA